MLHARSGTHNSTNDVRPWKISAGRAVKRLSSAYLFMSSSAEIGRDTAGGRGMATLSSGQKRTTCSDLLSRRYVRYSLKHMSHAQHSCCIYCDGIDMLVLYVVVCASAPKHRFDKGARSSQCLCARKDTIVRFLRPLATLACCTTPGVKMTNDKQLRNTAKMFAQYAEASYIDK